MAIGSQFHVHLYYTFLSLVRRSLLADRLSYVINNTVCIIYGYVNNLSYRISVGRNSYCYCDNKHILFGLAWASSVAHFTTAVFKQSTPKHHAEYVNNNKCSYLWVWLLGWRKHASWICSEYSMDYILHSKAPNYYLCERFSLFIVCLFLYYALVIFAVVAISRLLRTA